MKQVSLIFDKTQNSAWRWPFAVDAMLHLSATFRLENENDCEYEFSVMGTRITFKERNFSKCACSELRTRSRLRIPI